MSVEKSSAGPSSTEPVSAQPLTALSGDLGLYVHVPFCKRKCRYCAFYSLVASTDEQQLYLRALSRQIEQIAGSALLADQYINTIFFGGGTPTMLPAETLAELLRQCLRVLPTSEREAMEISLEVNPATVSLQDLRRLRRAGFNRLSIGVQSLHDRELRALGRPHNAEQALAVAREARQAGFDNLSLDLMYGLPAQSMAAWRDTLGRALDQNPDHLSIYELTPEPGTPLAVALERGELTLPDEEQVLAMMALTGAETATAGLPRYEISNYARPGHECAHNLNYWHNGPYLGLGPGAVSRLGERRLSACEDLARYAALIAQGREPWTDIEHLDRETMFRETVIMGLRLIRGVSLAELRERFAMDVLKYYGEDLTRLVEMGLLRIKAERLALTAKGLPVANAVMAELV